jgi:hypothetical protein
MKKLLLIVLAFLPAGLKAMDWAPYHNPGTVESMRAIAQRQIDEIKFQHEMAARQIQAQNQMTLAIAAEQQAAQAAQAAPQSGLVPRPTEAPICVKDHHEGKDCPTIQTRHYADRMENEMRDGRTQIYYSWMLCGKGGAPEVVRYAGKPQFQPGTFRETPTSVLTYSNGTVDKFYADGRRELEDGFGSIVRTYKNGRTFKIKYDDDGECVVLWDMN